MEKELTYTPKPEDFVIEGCDDAAAEQMPAVSLTYWQLSFKRFMENKVALAATVVLLLIVIMTIIGPHLVPYDMEAVNLEHRNIRPCLAYWFGTDQLGREVTIEEEPKTLASGYYISTSLLIALGVQNELVGVEAKADKRNIYSLSAPEIQSLPSIGTAKEFDLEGCAALAPDLVIVPAKLKDSIPQMEEMGLTVLAVKPENQAGLFGAIELLTQATNTTARGEELEMAIESNLAALAEAVADTDAPSVYLAGNSSVLETAGPAMYQNTMIENANGTNAAASVEDTYWAEVSYEQILDWNPDYIILASDAEYDVDSVLNDAALADCTAVKESHVYQLPHAVEAVDSPVPASFLGSVYLASVLHPEQVTEEYYHAAADEFYGSFYGFTPESYE